MTALKKIDQTDARFAPAYRVLEDINVVLGLKIPVLCTPEELMEVLPSC